MSTRWRTIAFSLVATMVVLGGACAAFVGGLTGEVLTIVLISGGLAGGLLLIFLDIGLGEERDLEREAEGRRKRDMRALDLRRRPRLPRRPRRPS
jgi:hypothetical protein